MLSNVLPVFRQSLKCKIIWLKHLVHAPPPITNQFLPRSKQIYHAIHQSITNPILSSKTIALTLFSHLSKQKGLEIKTLALMTIIIGHSIQCLQHKAKGWCHLLWKCTNHKFLSIIQLKKQTRIKDWEVTCWKSNSLWKIAKMKILCLSTGIPNKKTIWLNMSHKFTSFTHNRIHCSQRILNCKSKSTN